MHHDCVDPGPCHLKHPCLNQLAPLTHTLQACIPKLKTVGARHGNATFSKMHLQLEGSGESLVFALGLVSVDSGGLMVELPANQKRDQGSTARQTFAMAKEALLRIREVRQLHS